MAFSIATAFDIVCRLDRDDTLDEVPQNKKEDSCNWLASGQAA